VLALALVVGYYTGTILRLSRAKARVSDIQTPATPSPVPTITRTTGFIWGAQGGAYVLNNIKDTYHKENVDLQISKAKELGLNLLRANLEITTNESPYTLTFNDSDNDDFINRVSKSRLDLLLVLDPDITKTVGKTDYYKEGYRMGSYAAKRYKGKIKYYQIANEISGTIVKKPETQGELIKGANNIEYSKEMYDVTLNWLKGMSKGIRENDPNAKIVLSGHWILYDIFPMLIKDGADFDILGWSWYSEDGTDPTSREYNYGDHFNLAKKLKDIKKDVWIVETNSSGGSKGKNLSLAEGAQAQADFFGKFLPKIYSSGYFNGLIVYTLFDNPNSALVGNEADSHFGLVGAEISGGKVAPTVEKPAFETLKKFIQSHP
jgi:hypothetical protein